ncbi:unnamed protein product [Amoebophrya sp. A120]|nr:unnamed protein product [Amoebophrya sp. A120]|eukprot:GSA120T00000034001.1
MMLRGRGGAEKDEERDVAGGDEKRIWKTSTRSRRQQEQETGVINEDEVKFKDDTAADPARTTLGAASKTTPEDGPPVLFLSCKDDPDVHLENEKQEQQRVQPAAVPRNDPAVVMSSSSTCPAQLSWATSTTTTIPVFATPPTLVEDATASLPLIIQKVQKTSDADRSRDDIMQEHSEVLLEKDNHFYRSSGRTKINPNHKLLIEDNRASKKPPTSSPFSSGQNVSAVDIEDAEVVEKNKNLNFTRLLQKPFSRDYVKAVVTAYGKAWVEQDSDQLVQLFTANGMYKEKPGRCMHGAEEIRHYWKKQICQNESDIEFQHEEEDMVFDFEKKQATVKWLASFVKTSSSSSTSSVVPPWKRHGADGARGGGGGSGEADVLCFVQVATLRFRWVQVAESVGMWKIYCLEEYLHPFWNVNGIKEFLTREDRSGAKLNISIRRGDPAPPSRAGDRDFIRQNGNGGSGGGGPASAGGNYNRPTSIRNTNLEQLFGKRMQGYQ